MKSILISIKPKWCELIASGKKTVEVRKTHPKCETPFKVYIYATKAKDWLLCRDEYYGIGLLHSTNKGYAKKHNIGILSGKVIGEFVCDCITPLYNICVDKWELLQGGLHQVEKNMVQMANLSENELKQYANGKYPLFAWFISDLVIYDKPKALSDFRTSWTSQRKISAFVMSHKIDRAPQSWCYVEEV